MPRRQYQRSHAPFCNVPFFHLLRYPNPNEKGSFHIAGGIAVTECNGVYGLFLGLRYKNTLQVTKRIDANNYSASETVTIKIPLAIPYNGDTDFARVEGEIEYEGQIYRLVKQKLESDTLHVICIQDAKAKHLQEALTEYVKTFADQSADRSNTKTIQSFIKDYAPASFSLDAAADGWAELLHFKTVYSSDSTLHLTFPSPPPKS